MNLEQIVFKRKEAYDSKNYELSDELRSILESNNIFCFDHPDGFHEVHYYPKGPKLTRLEVEEKLRKDRLAEKQFDSWLYSQLNDNNP